ncbi:uncharacterized protein LOC129330618 [Eublepharis macularius]|uniref:Uncharacterized protein LOC129330618 n=1 Tax=Eublepharis macularius TaxID=481883 RepID=A0AA97JGR8_EUBMA|nr:uncharacterized protein LOC129330618 [Eublepharis macularius]
MPTLLTMAQKQVIVPELTEKSYSAWLQAHLKEEGAAAPLETDPPETGEDEIACWNDQNNKAKNVIVRCLSDKQLVYVKVQKTAKGMLRALQKAYGRHEDHSQVALFMELFSTRLQENGNADAHIETMLNLIDILAAGGRILDEILKIGLFLSSLPKSYSFISPSYGRETNLQDIWGQIRAEYRRRKGYCHQNKHNTDSNYLLREAGPRRAVTKPIDWRKPNPGGRRTAPRCFKRNKPGHLQRQCLNS